MTLFSFLLRLFLYSALGAVAVVSLCLLAAILPIALAILLLAFFGWEIFHRLRRFGVDKYPKRDTVGTR